MQEKQVCSKYTFTPRDRGMEQLDEPQLSDDLKDLFMEEQSLQENIEPANDETLKIPQELPQEESIENRLDNIYGMSQTQVNTLSLNSKKAKIEDYKYTINLATVKSEDEFYKFVQHYSLDKKNISTHKLNQRDQEMKLLYGKYETIADAKEVLSKFDDSLKRYVYIDNLPK
jgi:hypothetical protein